MAPAATKRLKKKSAPDKPMPEGTFPDDNKHSVSNPKIQTKEQQRKPVSAQVNTPPPALLLSLVGAFLTSYGFNNASHTYNTQLSSRKKVDNWKCELEEKLPKGFPDLVKIFKDWYKDYQESIHLEETSSDDEHNKSAQIPETLKREKKSARKKAMVTKENSSSSSSESSDSVSEESEASSKSESASPAPKVAKRVSNSASSSSSSSTSSSDSDADDEQEVVQKPQSASSSSSSDETSSSGDSDSSPPPPHASKPDRRVDKQPITKRPASIKSRDAGEVSKATAQSILPSNPPNISIKSSSSSATLEIPPTPKPAQASASETSSSASSSNSSSESSSSSDSPAPPQNAGVPLNPSKRKRSASPAALQPVAKKIRTPFQRVPKDTKVDVRLASNAYVSHEYGDRAHQDLSVTRGRGFTKEKNKKKRGSYRGGAIDVGGGKGIKFDD
ncbi:hypothetical protein MMC07_001569 [Pseudocyphellaria aurata]|nr:hypothetical protein [Pseudocyphellaria aurata]